MTYYITIASLVSFRVKFGHPREQNIHATMYVYSPLVTGTKKTRSPFFIRL